MLTYDEQEPRRAHTQYVVPAIYPSHRCLHLTILGLATHITELCIAGEDDSGAKNLVPLITSKLDFIFSPDFVPPLPPVGTLPQEKRVYFQLYSD